MIEAIEFAGALIIEIIDVGYRLTVKIDQLIGSKDDGCTMIENTTVGKCFDDQLGTNAIQIAAGNSYDGFNWSTHIDYLKNENTD